MAANFKTNVDAVVEAIETYIPTPKRDETLPFKMYVARSFDINKPGTDISKIKGGVVGGSLIQGKIQQGDEIEISPGIKRKIDSEEVGSITLKSESLFAGGKSVKEVKPGGLIAIGTLLDPAVTKGDRLLGNIIGKPGTLPEAKNLITLSYQLFDRTDFENPPLKMGEPIVISLGTATTVGVISKLSGDEITVTLKRKICADEDAKIALSRRVGQRWRLCGYGGLSG